jgi:FtsH-binding integral membrane protein
MSMSREQLEQQLEKWKRILLVYVGSAATLLVIALVELPATVAAANEPDASFVIDGWYAVWFVLVLACLTPGIMLLIGPSWRVVPKAQRLGTGFGFLGSAWVALMAFDLRVAALDIPPLFHYAVALFGVALLVAYLILKRKSRVGEELFP